MYRLIAIDPGAAHVGVVQADFDHFGLLEEVESWHKVFTPEEFYGWFEDKLIVLLVEEARSIVAFEEFRVHPFAKHQAYNQLETSQMIGVIRYVCRKFKIPCIGVSPADRKALSKTLDTNLKNDHLNSAYAVAVWTIRFGKPKLIGD